MAPVSVSVVPLAVWKVPLEVKASARAEVKVSVVASVPPSRVRLPSVPPGVPPSGPPRLASAETCRMPALSVVPPE